MSLLQAPLIPQFKSLSLSSPFLHTPFPKLTTTVTTTTTTTTTKPISIKAMKTLQGKVIFATNDKTISVEVTRLVPHPKYKRRVRIKKKFQAHDPDNKFKVGDVVQLEKSRPISKTKAFIALPVVTRKGKKPKEGGLGIPLESQQS